MISVALPGCYINLRAVSEVASEDGAGGAASRRRNDRSRVRRGVGRGARGAEVGRSDVNPVNLRAQHRGSLDSKIALFLRLRLQQRSGSHWMRHACVMSHWGDAWTA